VSCPGVEWLHAHVDGELDVVHSLEVEQHLQGCPACARQCDEVRALRATLRAGLARYPLPPGLRKRVSRALGRQAPRGNVRRWALLAASLLLVALGVVGGARLAGGAGDRDRLAQGVVDSHVRSQMADHLVDVPSSDSHTVKPWFQGKLDFSPPVRDLRAEGFPLAGGRLDYLEGRPVAAVVYRRRQHVINVLIWPEEGEAESAPRELTKQGYNLSHWRRGRMSWWVVSDLNRGELRELVEKLRE
jgi:anti-sigma factor RsiW